MTELIANNIYLILLLPFWIFLIIMLGRFFSVYVNKWITYILTLFSSLLGVFSCGALLYLFKPDTVYETSYPFIKINNFIINCGIHIDRLALIFGLILFLVSFFVQLYSISYMKDEKKKYRFCGLINLFNFSMASLFFSPNLFQTYFFWEIAGIISYLLIGFEYFKENKSIASKKVFIINRIGDTALIAGIIICSYLMYEYAPAKSLATLSYTDMSIVSTLVSAYLTEPLFTILCGLFILGCVVKSAQFPFYTWLQDAMEAKIPVSALLHSATLVALGIYLLIRLTPFFVLSDLSLKIITATGILTAIICSLSACAQSNPKKTLAYSTSAQLGLMFFAIGILNIKAALAIFSAHAVIKSVLFLTLPKENEEWNYTQFILFLISGLSLSGLLFAGMISKEMLCTTLGNNGTIVFSVISFLTAFYITRIALVVADNNNLIKSRPNFIETTSEIGMLGLNIAFYIYLRQICEYKIAEPFWAALTAWIFVYILYIQKGFKQIPIIYPLCLNGFYIDCFYTKFVTIAYSWFSKICYLIDLKIFGNYKPAIIISKFGVNIFNFVEQNIMNKSVSLVSDISKKISKLDSIGQTGNIQKYNLYAFIIITIILITLVIAYTAILGWIQGG